MKDYLIGLVFKWVFVDGLKEIEKKNYTTMVLEKLYKQPEFNSNWKYICDGVSALLQDAAEEAKTASTWTHA